jgi:hypothetical protein
MSTSTNTKHDMLTDCELQIVAAQPSQKKHVFLTRKSYTLT